VASGLARSLVEELLNRAWPEPVAAQAERVREGLALLDEAVAFAKGHGGMGYLDLYGRKLVDMACTLIIAALLCDHGTASEHKQAVAQRWLAVKVPELRMNKELVCSGDEAVIGKFEALVGTAVAVV
jgi:hypothetical protein